MDLLEFIRSVGLEFLLGFFCGVVVACVGGFFFYKARLKEWSAIMEGSTSTYKYTLKHISLQQQNALKDKAKEYKHILKQKDSIIAQKDSIISRLEIEKQNLSAINKELLKTSALGQIYGGS